MPKNNKFADDGLVADFAIHVKGRVTNLEDRGDGWDDSIASLDQFARKADLVPPGSKATIRHVEGKLGASPTYDVIRVGAGALNLKKIYQPAANAQGVVNKHGSGIQWATYKDLMRKEGHTAIVNADASTEMAGNVVRPVGLQIVDGRAVQDFGAGALAIGSDLESLIVQYDGTVIPARSADNKTAQDYVDEGAYFSIGYGPILCENGIPRNWQDDPRFSGFTSPGSQRTIFGQTANGDFIFIILKAGNISGSPSGNALGQLAVQEGCKIAVVLSGGDSSQAMWKGYNVLPSTHESGVERLHSMVVITAPEANDYDSGEISIPLTASVLEPMLPGKPSAFMRQVNDRVFLTLNAKVWLAPDTWVQLQNSPFDRVYESVGRVGMAGVLVGSAGRPIGTTFQNESSPGRLAVRVQAADSAAYYVAGTLSWVAQFA